MTLKALSSNIMQAANKIDGDHPWLILLDIQIGSEAPLYLVNNNEDVPFGGNTYIAFGFQIELPAETSKGEIPSVQLLVANATRSMQTYIEQYDGGVGASVTLRVVNAGLLAENYAELTTTLTVIASKVTSQWVTFTLGAINPLNSSFPPEQYIAMHCRFTFKGPHCGYSGGTAVCNKTLDFCKSLSNSVRFGGHPGLDSKGMRVV